MVEAKTENKSSEKYKKVTDAFFYASLSTIPIFAVPAFSVLIVGRYLDNNFETGKVITISLLFIAFISSWIFTMKKVKEMNKEYKKVREEMKQEQNQ